MAELRAAGQLALIGSPRWMKADAGRIAMKIELPRESLELVTVEW